MSFVFSTSLGDRRLDSCQSMMSPHRQTHTRVEGNRHVCRAEISEVPQTPFCNQCQRASLTTSSKPAWRYIISRNEVWHCYTQRGLCNSGLSACELQVPYKTMPRFLGLLYATTIAHGPQACPRLGQQSKTESASLTIGMTTTIVFIPSGQAVTPLLSLCSAMWTACCRLCVYSFPERNACPVVFLPWTACCCLEVT
jgi:hypothetical protein